ncbi:MAG TPA: glycosyltransferase [Gaiellaceae bacterium]|nr:glycosyltransferase [Gaiellaceae bacterium]
MLTAANDTLESTRPRTDPYARIRAFFDEFAPAERRWRRRNSTYHQLLAQIAQFFVLPGASVLEIGSGSGDLLAAVRPARSVGVDLSDGMVRLAREAHPGIEFAVSAGEHLDLGDETFDYIVLSDLVPYVHDLLVLFERVAAHAHDGTRVIISSYNSLWRPVFAVAEWLHLKPAKPLKNWVSPEDVTNVLELAGLEQVVLSRRILMPKAVPLISGFLNGVMANLWPFNHLCVTWWIVARPALRDTESLTVSVVCACRNEQGHIAELVERLPDIGLDTELIFVEGNSTDDTRGEIERQIALHPGRDIRLLIQQGVGKGDAVRTGFAAARNDVLMILDGDLSVRPEDLPKFYNAISAGSGELINGSRLVYDMEPGAMRFLNMLGNKMFSRAFKAITGQHVKDTLCGTKVLLRRDYDRIAAGRPYFGEFDPFGDFDLLFGGARLGLKIIDLPVRYQARTYGQTNISRWSHGLLLLRMTLFALWKFRVGIYRTNPA